MDIGPGELLIVAAAVLLLFGGSRIPQLARSLGRAQSEFRRGLAGDKADESGPASEGSPAAATSVAADSGEPRSV